MSNEIATTESQGEFVFFGLQHLDRTQPRYHATGKLLQKHRPEVYRIAVDLLAAGRHSQREMCEILHISGHTLESIETEQAESLAALRQKAARRNLRLHHLSLDQLEDLIPTMRDGAKVAVVAGITAEKAQLFAGEATARIEQIQPVSLVERIGAFVHELEKRVQARIIDSTEEKIPAKSDPGAALLTQGEPPSEHPAADGSGHLESDLGSSPGKRFTQRNATDASNQASNLPRFEPPAPATAEGGGGGRASEGGLEFRTDNPA